MSTNPIPNLMRSIYQALPAAPPEDHIGLSVVMKLGVPRQVQTTYGFIYGPNGQSMSVALDPQGVQAAVEAYLDAQYAPGAAWPVAMLVQYDRPGGNVEVQFEDTDTSRWSSSSPTLADEVRPDFESSDGGDDPAANLIYAIMDNLRNEPPDWQSLSLVIQLVDPVGTSGYLYSPNGQITATAVDPQALSKTVPLYLNEHYEDDQPWPVKLLVQFNRETGAFGVDFEDTDLSRWDVTPANIETIREELRPDL